MNGYRLLVLYIFVLVLLFVSGKFLDHRTSEMVIVVLERIDLFLILMLVLNKYFDYNKKCKEDGIIK